VAMPAEERRARMARMHQHVREHNIYRWAGLLLSELERIPEATVNAPEAAAPSPATSRALNGRRSSGP
jgi:trehalose-6-phosphate synthase